MFRISILLSLSLLLTTGCKSGHIVRLRDPTLQEYHPTIPLDAESQVH